MEVKVFKRAISQNIPRMPGASHYKQSLVSWAEGSLLELNNMMVFTLCGTRDELGHHAVFRLS